ncbi:MAG: porin family protein [Flavobacteriaceae bacterium]|nr:porin family protein [Flavobacteriaceae bacterium]
MKKLLLTVVFTVLSIVIGFAQATENEEDKFTGFEKGDFLITGGISYSSFKVNDNRKDNIFTFVPKAGYFISENMAIGAAFGISSTRSDGVFSFDDELRVNTFSAGAFGRYYFTPARKFSVFTELGASYITSENEYNGSIFSEVRSNGFAASFAPGINYFISKSFALEASFGLLSYTSLKDDLPGAEAVETFDLNLDLTNINFGLVFKF